MRGHGFRVNAGEREEVRNRFGTYSHELNLTDNHRNKNEHAMIAKATPATSAVRPAANA